MRSLTVVALVAAVAMVAARGCDEPRQPRARTDRTAPRLPVTVARTTPSGSTARALAEAETRLSFVARAGSQSRRVALTFDDGPGPRTAEIMAILRRHGAGATFFQVGTEVMERPRLTAAIARDSRFEVGNHTWGHPRLDRLRRGEQRTAILDGARAIISASGGTPRLFRPPYGVLPAAAARTAKRIGELPVLWSVDSRDYTRPGAAAITARVVREARPGAIVLMHDGGGDRSQTVAALPKILERLEKRGYSVVRVSELLARNRPPRRQPRPLGYGP